LNAAVTCIASPVPFLLSFVTRQLCRFPVRLYFRLRTDGIIFLWYLFEKYIYPRLAFDLETYYADIIFLGMHCLWNYVRLQVFVSPVPYIKEQSTRDMRLAVRRCLAPARGRASRSRLAAALKWCSHWLRYTVL
jgi:hypothetical protein